MNDIPKTECYTYDQIRKAYENTPEVAGLVNAMTAIMERLQVTPAELRAIATFAAFKFEQEKTCCPGWI